MGTSMAAPHVTGAIGLIGAGVQAGARTAAEAGRDHRHPRAFGEHDQAPRLGGRGARRRPARRAPGRPLCQGRDLAQAAELRAPDTAVCDRVLRLGHRPHGLHGRRCSWTAGRSDPGRRPNLGRSRRSATASTSSPWRRTPSGSAITVRWPAIRREPVRQALAAGRESDAEGQTPDCRRAADVPGRPSAYFQSRVFPDQEATGLPVGLPPTYRLVEVRAPEETDPAPIRRKAARLRRFRRASGSCASTTAPAASAAACNRLPTRTRTSPRASTTPSRSSCRGRRTGRRPGSPRR